MLYSSSCKTDEKFTSAIDLMSTCPPPLALAAQQLAMKIEAAATDKGERPHTRFCSLALQEINLDLYHKSIVFLVFLE